MVVLQTGEMDGWWVTRTGPGPSRPAYRGLVPGRGPGGEPARPAHPPGRRAGVITGRLRHKLGAAARAGPLHGGGDGGRDHAGGPGAGGLQRGGGQGGVRHEGPSGSGDGVAAGGLSVAGAGPGGRIETARVMRSGRSRAPVIAARTAAAVGGLVQVEAGFLRG